MLKTKTLTSFIQTFYGYGNLSAQLWFIGMEEGGGKTELEIQNRLGAWTKRGRRTIDDAMQFHNESGMSHLFAKDARIQKTWKELIRLIFAVRSMVATNKRMTRFQIEEFGRSNGCAAFLELLPLPSPNSKVWNYGNGQGKPLRPWTNVRYLQTRKLYEEHFRNSRAVALQELIRKYRPKAVVFYGKSNSRFLEVVCDVDFARAHHAYVVDGTAYMLLPHPTYRYGPTEKLFFQAGKKLKNLGLIC